MFDNIEILWKFFTLFGVNKHFPVFLHVKTKISKYKIFCPVSYKILQYQHSFLIFEGTVVSKSLLLIAPSLSSARLIQIFLYTSFQKKEDWRPLLYRGNGKLRKIFLYYLIGLEAFRAVIFFPSSSFNLSELLLILQRYWILFCIICTLKRV